MATYSNQHWLLSHIRNSFISTDDTGICETVMTSNDLPKEYLQRFQSELPALQSNKPRKSLNDSKASNAQPQQPRNWDTPLYEVDYICYPGLDQSDDEDMDLTAQSFDIQMYPEVGAHRFRSNTAQKLEKMDIARRKAARTKCVNFDDEIIPPERDDYFVKKPVGVMLNQVNSKSIGNDNEQGEFQWPENMLSKPKEEVKQQQVNSVLSQQLANTQQVQNKFMEYARFDGTSHTGVQTKRINVFLSMLPEKERNYPLKICVIATAKILEVIGLVCYKAVIQYPNLPLKSLRHYGLFMAEDNDDLDDFPPLDNREPCSKFGFSHLTLAERRLHYMADHQHNMPSKSLTSSEEEKAKAAAAVRTLQNIELNGGANNEEEPASKKNSLLSNQLNIEEKEDESSYSELDKTMMCHNEVLEAPMYRTYRLNIIDKRFFKTEVTLGISGERLEIDQHKNAKFWAKQKAVTYPIDAIAFCEIVERKHLKAVLRIWLRAHSSTNYAESGKHLNIPENKSLHIASSPTSPGHYPANFSSPFAFLTGASNLSSSSSNASTSPRPSHPQMRFKHYDFECDMPMAEQINNKLNCILEVRFSEVRSEFLHLRERKLEKNQSKKNLKL